MKFDESYVAQIESIPIISSAKFVKKPGSAPADEFSIEVKYKSKVYSGSEATESLTFCCQANIKISGNSASLLNCTAPIQVDAEVEKFKSYSSNKNVFAIGKMIGKKEDQKAVLQIWRDDKMEYQIDLKDVHGEFCTDGNFLFINRL